MNNSVQKVVDRLIALTQAKKIRWEKTEYEWGGCYTGTYCGIEIIVNPSIRFISIDGNENSIDFTTVDFPHELINLIDNYLSDKAKGYRGRVVAKSLRLLA